MMNAFNCTQMNELLYIFVHEIYDKQTCSVVLLISAKNRPLFVNLSALADCIDHIRHNEHIRAI